MPSPLSPPLRQARQHTKRPASPLAAITGLVLASLHCAAFAQNAPASVEQQTDAIQRQLQERLRQDQDRARQLVQPGTRPGPDVPAPQIAVPALGAPCRHIKAVRITGATKLAPAVRQSIEQSYASRCLKVADLEEILGALTKNYIDQGYVTTRAYLPAQDLGSGILEIQIVEGTIEAFEARTSRAGSVWIEGAFASRPGDLLNLRDLEQGIDQINRLGSNNAQLDIRPGSVAGQSVVVVENQSRLPVRAFLSLDDQGSEPTGKHNALAVVSFDSLLGLNESIALTRRQSVPHAANRNSESSSIALSLPWGYNTLSVDAAVSKYTTGVTLPSGALLVSRGETVSGGVALDRVVFRDKSSRVNVTGKLAAQSTQTYLADQLLNVASRKLSHVELGISGFTVAMDGLVNGRLAYLRGVPFAGGMDDPAGLPFDAPKARFNKLALDLGFTRQLNVMGQALGWSSQFSGQYTRTPLYGAQQIGIGGVSSVRGAVKNSISGDVGAYWRNELSLPFRLTPLGQNAGGRAYVGVDVGQVRGLAAGTPAGSLSGLTLGTALQFGAASLDIFASRAFHLPATMNAEPTQFGFRLSVSL